MNRTLRTALLGLVAAAGLGTSALASIPHTMPLSGRIQAAPVRAVEAGAAPVALAYAAPMVATARPIETPAALDVVPAPIRGEEATPALRRPCPAKSWPNLAPRCVADATGARS